MPPGRSVAPRRATGRLRVTLLGTFEARRSRGAALALSKKAQGLLSYLALTTGHACGRGELAALLWGDTSDVQARQSLRQTLRRLRSALGARDGTIRVDGDTVALDPTAVDVDTIALEHAVAAARDQGALEHAVALYRGDLLAGLDLAEAPFDEWLTRERERLRDLALGVIGRLLAAPIDARGADAAVRAASRALAIDPLHEVAHRAVMRAHAVQGRRAAAMRQYQVCVDVLQRELGVEPSAETKQLYQDIVRERGAPPLPRHVAPSGEPAVEKAAPFVGRDDERARLGELLREARRGHGRLAVIAGEAGIGKTRLVSWLTDTAAAAGARVLVGRSHASEQILPLGPWSDALRGGADDDPGLFQGLGEGARGPLAHLVPKLLAAGATAPPLRDDPERLFDSVVQLLIQLANARPLVVVLEDVHWADETSLRLLAEVSRRLRARRVLIVATVREEELADNLVLRELVHGLGRDGRLTTIALGSLSQAETAALVRAVAHLGDAGAVEHLVAQVWDISEGQPFMAVETVHALEQGTAATRAARLALPERVREVVLGRLERVSESGRQLLAAAAVIGRDFEFALLELATGVGEAEAAEGVEELVRRRLLRVLDERFVFTHDRIREVAYSELLPPRRRLLHRQVAEALTTLYSTPASVDANAVALAGHFAGAGDWELAASFARRAGAAAYARSAYVEAVASFEQALAALGRLRPTDDTMAEEIDVRLDLHNALYHVHGPDDTRAEMLDVAARLAQKVGDGVRFRTALLSRAALCLRRADAVGAVEAVQQALAVAAPPDSGAQVWANFVMGCSYVSLGELQQSAERLGANMRELDQDRRGASFGGPSSMFVASSAWLAHVRGELGDLAGARRAGHEALAVAEAFGEVPGRLFTAVAMGRAWLVCGAHDEILPVLERTAAVGSSRETAYWLPMLLSVLACACVRAGRLDDARRHLKQAVSISGGAITTDEWLGSHNGSYLVEAWSRAEDARTAMTMAERGLAAATVREHFGIVPKLHRAIADIAAAGGARGLERAQREYEQALGWTARFAMRPEAARIHLGLAAVCRARGDVAGAREHREIGVREVHAMGITLGAW